MSYQVIKIYEFECDHPDCAETCDITPWQDTGSLLRAAERDLIRAEHWTARGGKHYCPNHAETRG